jgi:hypothetical protein
MPQSTTRPPATRSSTASSPARSGSTITERKKLLRAPGCRALDRILRTNQRQAPRAAYPENGEACCTSKLAVGRGRSNSGVAQTNRPIVDALPASVLVEPALSRRTRNSTFPVNALIRRWPIRWPPDSSAFQPKRNFRNHRSCGGGCSANLDKLNHAVAGMDRVPGASQPLRSLHRAGEPCRDRIRRAVEATRSLSGSPE